MGIPAYAQRISHSVNVVEPGSNQGYLQNAFVVKADGAQAFVVGGGDAGRILCYLHDVIQHHTILLPDRGMLVVFLQRSYQLAVKSNATQKLCVRFDSIVAAVGYGNHGCDHLVLLTLQRQVR